MSDLHREMESLQRERQQLVMSGQPAHDVIQRINEVRRAIREKSRLREDSELLGRYRLAEQIGAGGFATVWKAYDSRAGQPVALKVLHGQWSHDATRMDRFHRGARQMARLDHPSIVRVLHEEGEHDGHHFFVMEFLSGGDLRSRILAGELTPDQSLDCVLEIADALQYAHEHNLIHRDVKPANILLDATGRAKLTDFDLVYARDTTGGTRTGALGTVVYSAPECMQQAKNAKPPSDVYSLGMTAIFALKRHELNYVHVLRDADGYLKDLAVNRSVRSVLVRAVQPEVADRFLSAREFADALRAALATTGGGIDLSDEQWVTIPAGKFRMGAQKMNPNLPNSDKDAHDDESPVHGVTLETFQISRFPVTVEQYRHFVDDDGYGEQRWWEAGGFGEFSMPSDWERQLEHPSRPVVGVSWFEASACCAWSNVGLPTEAQWERAARGTEARKYPWGNEEPDGSRMNYSGNGPRHPTPADAYPLGATPDEILDLAGNVWEWCADGLRAYTTDAVTNPVGAQAASRVARGGGWISIAGFCRSAFRFRFTPVLRDDFLGFRVAAVPPGGAGKKQEEAQPRAEARTERAQPRREKPKREA